VLLKPVGGKTPADDVLLTVPKDTDFFFVVRCAAKNRLSPAPRAPVDGELYYC